jgi:D-threo-aldose 1-dehydrogenase
MGFGGSSIGNLFQSMDDATANATVHHALARGFTYFDTAPHYGFGLSESRLGAALASAAGVVISSKVGRVLEPVVPLDRGAPRHGFVDAAPFEPHFDYTYDGVMRSFEASCKRLRRERLEILFAHDLGEATHGADHPRRFKEFFDGGYAAMRSLRDAGVVSAIGLGVNEWQICEQALGFAEFDCMLLAGRYTLLDQSALNSFFPLCVRRGVSLIIGGPYNSGILVHGARSGQRAYYDYLPASAEVLTQVARIEEICTAHHVPLAAAALQFPLAHPAVVSVIPGIANVGQIDDTLRWASVRIPGAFWADMRDAELMHPSAPAPDSSPVEP